MMKFVCVFAFLVSGVYSNAQTQVVRGKITDRENQKGLQGVTVVITTHGADSGKSSVTDTLGEFEIASVAVGRHNLLVSCPGYHDIVLQNIVIVTAKETILNLEMQEEVKVFRTARISAKAKGQPNNNNALVSARLFTVDETDRFAGSRGDPARMASNFAGVQGADDSRNDIVVRGNSPQGVLWRLEGIDIPNPNHFAIPGTTGGPVSIINNKILANSDFFTGAFPAEYGNSTAGVFDLRMRNGNNRKHEFSTQFGFLGWDLMAEGPLSTKNKSSYLVTYRYSTLAMFNALNRHRCRSGIPGRIFQTQFPPG
jgi:hypothetical protein